jgi:hypothetical protein
MTPYALLLVAHSYIRWIVLALAVALLARSARGWAGERAWTRGDEITQLAFVSFVDLQLLVGAWLYLQASPIARAFLADPGHARKVAELRFFGLEHPVVMIGAVVAVHVGRRRSKAKDRHPRTARWTIGAIVLMLLGVPWPLLHPGRPWLRGASEPSSAAATATAGACPPAYAARCAACHGEHGHGDGVAANSLSPRPRDFADPVWRARRTDAEIAAVIAEGGATHGLSPAMPAQADLTKAQVDALVSCVRSVAPLPIR